MRRSKREEGFTLLMAILVSSLVLTLGIAIVSVVRKSVMLSSIGRESQFAFYAADSGAECAMYWDLRHQLFSTSSPPASVDCNAQTVPVDATIPGSFSTQPSIFTFAYELSGRCVRLRVEKRHSFPHTVIHADGFNSRCVEVETNVRSLERSVEWYY